MRAGCHRRRDPQGHRREHRRERFDGVARPRPGQSAPRQRGDDRPRARGRQGPRLPRRPRRRVVAPAGDGDRRGDRRRSRQPVHRPGDPRHRQGPRRRADAAAHLRDPGRRRPTDVGREPSAQPPCRRHHRRRRPLRRPSCPRGGDQVHTGGRRRARPAGEPASARLARRPGGRSDGGAPPDRPRPHTPRRVARPDGHRQLRRPARGIPRRLP